MWVVALKFAWKLRLSLFANTERVALRAGRGLLHRGLIYGQQRYQQASHPVDFRLGYLSVERKKDGRFQQCSGGFRSCFRATVGCLDRLHGTVGGRVEARFAQTSNDAWRIVDSQREDPVRMRAGCSSGAMLEWEEACQQRTSRGAAIKVLVAVIAETTGDEAQKREGWLLTEAREEFVFGEVPDGTVEHFVKVLAEQPACADKNPKRQLASENFQQCVKQNTFQKEPS